MGIEESRKGASVFITIQMDPAKQLDPDAFQEGYDQVAESDPDLGTSATTPPRGFKGLTHLQLGSEVSPEDAMPSTGASLYARQQQVRTLSVFSSELARTTYWSVVHVHRSAWKSCCTGKAEYIVQLKSDVTYWF